MKKDEVVIGRTYLTKVGRKLVPVRIDETHGKSSWYATDRTTNERVEIKNAKELRREVTDDETVWEGEMAEAAPPGETPATIAPTEPEMTPDVATTAPETPISAEPAAVNDGQQATPAPEPTVPATPSYEERLMFAGATDPAAAREALANTTQSGTENDMATKNAKKGSKKNESKTMTKASGAAKPKREPKEKKVSALDAAAKVLCESKEPMTTGEMIEAMAKKGLWKSPGGLTPAATLYSAILREINVKGKESRFAKTERGKFGIKA
jgi:HB1/ASXL restriction endonuclease-like protein with HTH domain